MFALKKYFFGLILKIASINSRFNDWLHRNYKVRQDAQLQRSIDDLMKDDPIQDQSKLKMFRAAVEEDLLAFTTYDLNTTTNRMYGICPSLFGTEEKISINYPACEHGVMFHNQLTLDITRTIRPVRVTSSPFRKNVLRQHTKLPIFCVGPYIQYASDYYTKEKMEEVKSKLGKNLLVFPTHGTDDTLISMNEEKYMQCLKTKGENFDSVTICVFWWDINDSFVKRFAQEGFYIVSAGFREDPLFLSRLKTIISLCDLAVGDEIGSHVGYCESLGKTYHLLNIDSQSIYSPLSPEGLTNYQKHKTMIMNAFSEEDKKLKRNVYNQYFGGDVFRTREELDKILEINRKIQQISHGFSCLYDQSCNQLLHTFNAEGDLLGYTLLKEALE